MSILIKGIDMPKDMPIILLINHNGVVAEETDDFNYKIYKEDVKAIQIPTPHGRLIDEDDLISELTELQDLNLESIAPTILESEE